jgi:hypothetical protein
MSEQTTFWMDWLLKDPTVDLESELGQELVRCVTQFDKTGHPSFVDMAVLKSFQMSGMLPTTILHLCAYQAKARLGNGPKGHFSKALREEARQMGVTTMTGLLAAGLDPAEASLRAAAALAMIYGKQPNMDSTIRRAYNKFKKTAEGAQLLKLLVDQCRLQPEFRQKLLDEVSKLKLPATGVYN